MPSCQASIGRRKRQRRDEKSRQPALQEFPLRDDAACEPITVGLRPGAQESVPRKLVAICFPQGRSQKQLADMRSRARSGMSSPAHSIVVRDGWLPMSCSRRKESHHLAEDGDKLPTALPRCPSYDVPYDLVKFDSVRQSIDHKSCQGIGRVERYISPLDAERLDVHPEPIKPELQICEMRPGRHENARAANF